MRIRCGILASGLLLVGTSYRDTLLVTSAGANVNVTLNGSLTQWPGVGRVLAYGEGGDGILMATGSLAPV